MVTRFLSTLQVVLELELPIKKFACLFPELSTAATIVILGLITF